MIKLSQITSDIILKNTSDISKLLLPIAYKEQLKLRHLVLSTSKYVHILLLDSFPYSQTYIDIIKEKLSSCITKIYLQQTVNLKLLDENIISLTILPKNKIIHVKDILHLYNLKEFTGRLCNLNNLNLFTKLTELNLDITSIIKSNDSMDIGGLSSVKNLIIYQSGNLKYKTSFTIFGLDELDLESVAIENLTRYTLNMSYTVRCRFLYLGYTNVNGLIFIQPIDYVFIDYDSYIFSEICEYAICLHVINEMHMNVDLRDYVNLNSLIVDSIYPPVLPPNIKSLSIGYLSDHDEYDLSVCTQLVGLNCEDMQMFEELPSSIKWFSSKKMQCIEIFPQLEMLLLKEKIDSEELSTIKVIASKDYDPIDLDKEIINISEDPNISLAIRDYLSKEVLDNFIELSRCLEYHLKVYKISCR